MPIKKLARVTRMGPRAILEGVNPEMFRQAYEHGMSLSAYMEQLDPTQPGDETGLDAFGRVMQEANVFTRSEPSAGIYADTWEDAFDRTSQRRMLGIEWARRQWLRGSTGREVNTRAVMMSDDYTLNSSMRPYADAAVARTQQLAPQIPLAELVAVTTPISGDAYRTVYLQDVPADQKRKVRVGEAAEIPRVKLTTSEHTVRLYKYGRVLEASYETLRRQRLDRVAMQIALMAIQAEDDKVATAIDVLINGDGNSNPASFFNLTALDPSTTANNATLLAWLAFKLKFKSPYMMTALLAQEGGILKAMLINTGSANIPLVAIANFIGVGGFRLMNSTLRDNVGYGSTDHAPANKWVGVDTRMALERVTEIGADITEIERAAITQTEALVMTEVEGYGKIYSDAVKGVNLAA